MPYGIPLLLQLPNEILYHVLFYILPQPKSAKVDTFPLNHMTTEESYSMTFIFTCRALFKLAVEYIFRQYIVTFHASTISFPLYTRDEPKFDNPAMRILGTLSEGNYTLKRLLQQEFHELKHIYYFNRKRLIHRLTRNYRLMIMRQQSDKDWLETRESLRKMVVGMSEASKLLLVHVESYDRTVHWNMKRRVKLERLEVLEPLRILKGVRVAKVDAPVSQELIESLERDMMS
ncbi:MAG: hypothetical protein M1820_000120 [Bogoriella megaspora]|nr:MAG: hypothetical protein M1820_000120 [Bogoriella megaspora]